MNRSAIILLLVFFTPCISDAQTQTAAQADDIKRQQYLQTAYAIDSEVWKRDLPQFSDYDVAMEYPDESAVIIAYNRDIKISAKKGSGFAKFMGGHGGGNILYTDIQRIMVRIGERSALDYYSDFDFKQLHENKMGAISNKYTTFMGARIIKPDGKIVYPDIYNQAVKITEGKDDKEAYHRLAIPNLQIGDILDYYFCYIFDLQAGDITDRSIGFYTVDYPMLHLSARITVDGPVTLEYRAINGAPDFKRCVTEDGSNVLDVVVENPLRINNFNAMQWVAPLRSLPMIRFSVLQNESRSSLITPSARPSGIHKNVPYGSIIDDAAWYIGLEEVNIGKKSDIKNDINAFIAANPSADKAALAQYIADRIALVWNFYGYLNACNSRSFAIILHELLTEYGIECKVGFVSKRSLTKMNEIFDPSDTYSIVTANDNSRIFIYGGHLFHPPAELSGWFAGETAVLFAGPTIKKTILPIKNQGLKGDKITFTLPLSSDAENVWKTAMTVKLSDSDASLLEISRTSSLTGELKREMQPFVLIRDDWDREMRKYLRTAHASFIDELDQKRSTRKYREEWRARFDKEREEQKNRIKAEIFSFHDIEPETVTGYRFANLGVTAEFPTLEFTSDYTMRGFIRRAGEDIILEIGKFAGSQWTLSDDERNRPIDVWLSSSRRYETEVCIDIPEGYAADVSKFSDMAVDNKYGSFTASISVEQDRLIVKTTKIYKENYIPVVDFGILLEMIDAANEFYGKSVILSKKKR